MVDHHDRKIVYYTAGPSEAELVVAWVGRKISLQDFTIWRPVRTYKGPKKTKKSPKPIIQPIIDIKQCNV